MRKRIKHKGAWFVNRIGKKIYRRRSNSCECEYWQKEYVIVVDLIHAHVLFIAQTELKIECFDKPFGNEK